MVAFLCGTRMDVVASRLSFGDLLLVDKSEILHIFSSAFKVCALLPNSSQKTQMYKSTTLSSIHQRLVSTDRPVQIPVLTWKLLQFLDLHFFSPGGLSWSRRGRGGRGIWVWVSGSACHAAAQLARHAARWKRRHVTLLVITEAQESRATCNNNTGFHVNYLKKCQKIFRYISLYRGVLMHILKQKHEFWYRSCFICFPVNRRVAEIFLRSAEIRFKKLYFDIIYKHYVSLVSVCWNRGSFRCESGDNLEKVRGNWSGPFFFKHFPGGLVKLFFFPPISVFHLLFLQKWLNPDAP